jgi:DNA-binding NarL/FixJ family response regulator
MAYIRTLLVDDSLEFLEAAIHFLASDPNIKIVGSSISGYDAIEQVKLLKPDLVLMDLALPGMNGLETTRQIKSEEKPPRVIILTLHDNDEYRFASASAQADGFIAKSDFGSDLLPLIEYLFEENTLVESELSKG